MSHIVTIKTQVKDPIAIRAACERLQLEPPVQGESQLFSSVQTGWQVKLRDWRYPVVCETAKGELYYDNFEGRWGDPVRLNEFLQRYAVEKATLEARRAGHGVTEQLLEDGSVKLTVVTGGAS